ncbi:MAG TPA: hypothetical protein VN317_01845, partial [Candidatus Methanoperedens sp.]|nr:hypothetical protein [Candidatus Methanoperedens sp.]
MAESDAEVVNETGRLPVRLYGVAIFVSAFLLFQVQLIVAKVILPWFGGAAAVWATCMLFYQAALLLGYLYADWSVRFLRARTQTLLHLALLAAALVVVAVALLPLPGSTGWKPAGPGAPVLRI